MTATRISRSDMNINEELRALRARVESIPEDNKRQGRRVSEIKNFLFRAIAECEQLERRTYVDEILEGLE
jgi:hypothetical protein